MIRNVSSWLTSLPRHTKQIVMMVTDAIGVPLGMWIAFSVRLGEVFPDVSPFYMTFIAAPIVVIIAFIYFDLYRTIIRYMDAETNWIIFKAVTISTLIIALFVLLSGGGLQGFPRSVLFSHHSAHRLVGR